MVGFTRGPGRFLQGLILFTCFLSPSFAQDEKPIGQDVTVTFAARERSLREVMAHIASRAGVNIVVADDIDVSITLDLTDVAWKQAMELAAEKGECIVIQTANNVFKIERPPRVHFSFDGADISEVIDTIAKLSGANIMFDSEVSGAITLRLKDVPWRTALDMAAKQLGYTVVEEPHGILRIVHASKLKADLEVRSFQLKYLSPRPNFEARLQSTIIQVETPQNKQGRSQEERFDETFDVLLALRGALTEDGKLQYIQSRNVIIVRDIRPVVDQIEKMIERWDVEPRQVFVDVKFVQTTNTDIFDFGTDYGQNGPSASLSLGAIPHSLPFILGDGGFEDGIIVTNPGTGGVQQPDPQGGGSGPFPGAFSPGAIPQTQYGILDFTGIALTLRLLKSDTKARVVQAPRIIALDRHQSTIFVGEEIHYAEAKTEQGQAGGLSLTVQEASGSPVETGFQLLMRPHIVPGTKKVILDVIPKQQSLSGSGGDGAPAGFDVFRVGENAEGFIALPRLLKAELATRLMLESGQTAVIGGLTTDSDSEIVRKVPFLGDIPVLGWFFKFSSTTKDRRSLIVLISPYIISSPEDSDAWLQRELEGRRGTLENALEQLLNESGPGEAVGASMQGEADIR